MSAAARKKNKNTWFMAFLLAAAQAPALRALKHMLNMYYPPVTLPLLPTAAPSPRSPPRWPSRGAAWRPQLQGLPVPDTSCNAQTSEPGLFWEAGAGED